MEFLGHTFGVNKNPGKVEYLQLQLLFQGVKGVYKWLEDEVVEDYMGNDVNNGLLFVKRLLALQERLRVTEEPEIRVGGMLAPIFEWAGVDFSNNHRAKEGKIMDMRYLIKRNFLHSYQIHDKVLYLFIDEKRKRRAVYMPIQELTTTTKDENLEFKIPHELYANVSTLGPTIPSKDGITETHPDQGERYQCFYTPYRGEEPSSSRPRTELEKYLSNKVNHQEKALKKQGNFISRFFRKFKRVERQNRYATSSEEEEQEEDKEEESPFEKPRHSIANPTTKNQESRNRNTFDPPRRSYQGNRRSLRGSQTACSSGPASRTRFRTRSKPSTEIVLIED